MGCWSLDSIKKLAAEDRAKRSSSCSEMVPSPSALMAVLHNRGGRPGASAKASAVSMAWAGIPATIGSRSRYSHSASSTVREKDRSSGATASRSWSP